MAVIHQINISNGGVPKTPVERAEVGIRGIVGDRQADRIHHGHPEQALCLYSLEVIETLRAEGHPIGPGSAGENLTLSGFDWTGMVPGLTFGTGDELTFETTDYATPCTKNAQWFKDGKFGRMLHSRHPGESRIYARVLTPGSIEVGDKVRLIG